MMQSATMMGQAGRLIAVALGLSVGFAAVQVQACSPVEITASDLRQNKRVKQVKDCSFVNGGIHDFETGKAAEDLGQGRVMQKLWHDSAILLDCTTGESLFLFGKEDPANSTSCGPYYELERYEAPAGPLDYRAGSDLTEFRKIVGRLGIVFGEDAESHINSGAKRRDIVDVSCGCKLFYPGSKGADG